MTDDYSADLAAEAAAASAAGAAGLGLAIGMVIFWIIASILGLVLFLWALIDCIKRDFTNPNEKLIWILVIIIIGWVGPIVYLIVGRKNGKIRGQSAATQ